jgi:hypothetical protein
MSQGKVIFLETNFRNQFQESLVLNRNVNNVEPHQIPHLMMKRNFSNASTNYSDSRNNSEHNNDTGKSKKSKRKSGLANFIKNQRQMIKQANQGQQFSNYY